MATIETLNDGGLIISSTYWGSELEAAGKYWVSVNAGTVRVLIPRSVRGLLGELQSSTYCILSRGPWPAERKPEAVELLWEDGSDSPFAMHFSPESFDLLPADPGERGWEVAVWEYKRDRPHSVLRRPCHWRRVPRIPWLKPLDTVPEVN